MSIVEVAPLLAAFIAGVLTGGSISAWLARKALWAIVTVKVEIRGKAAK